MTKFATGHFLFLHQVVKYLIQYHTFDPKIMTDSKKIRRVTFVDQIQVPDRWRHQSQL